MRTVLGGVAIAISVAFAIPSTPFAHTATSVERGGVRKQYAAVAFDYLVLFDPDSVVSAIDRIAHGRAENPPVEGDSSGRCTSLSRSDRR
jgi:hypothetical protein